MAGSHTIRRGASRLLNPYHKRRVWLDSKSHMPLERPSTTSTYATPFRLLRRPSLRTAAALTGVAAAAAALAFATGPPQHLLQAPFRYYSAMTAPSSPDRPFSARLRPWHARMHDDHGWLRTFLTFSFAGHYDADWTSFGPLRVLNEDRISAGTGFPTHPHKQYEIFSYVVGGELTHRDSMGNSEVLKRGEVQYTRAGTGIAHSEYNGQQKQASRDADTHFLQIWLVPDAGFQGVKPEYFSTSQSRPEDEELKRDKLLTLIRPASTIDEAALKAKREASQGPAQLLAPGEAIPAHASVVVRASILSSVGSAVTHVWGTHSDVADDKGTERWGVIHLAMRSGYKDPRSAARKTVPGEARLRVTASDDREYTLGEGDSLFIKGASVGDKVRIERLSPVQSAGEGGDDAKPEAEFLLFDLEPSKDA
ncbi:unnamed protein product [Parajaminaea phylloscopi]